MWSEETRGAVVLLAALADRDPALLRGAANRRAQEWESVTVRGLLLDAATERH
jgi:hypothetical protein